MFYGKNMRPVPAIDERYGGGVCWLMSRQTVRNDRVIMG